MSGKTTLNDIVGSSFDDDFLEFDLTEIQEILSSLRNVDAIDLAHAEFLQQRALRGADILSEYLGRIVKVVSYLESKVNSVKNKAMLEYKAPDGKTTADMKKSAGESDPEVEKVTESLARAKGSKVLLEKKFDILIKSHHHHKDIAQGLRRTVLGFQPPSDSSKEWG